MLSLVLM
jgi:hypothetical protein